MSRKVIGKKILTLLLSVMMVLTMMPSLVFADEAGAVENHAPVLVEGVTDVEAQVVINEAYLLRDLQAGKIFVDPDGDPLYVVAPGVTGESSTNYYYQKSTDGGKTWGEEQSFAGSLFGATTIAITEKEAGIYNYRFYAKDGKGGNSADDGVYWNLKLTVDTAENLTFETTFNVGKDQNFDTNGGKNAAIKVYPSLGTDPATGYAIPDYDHPVTFLNSDFAAADDAAGGYMDENGTYNQFFSKINGGWYVVEGYGWNTETEAYDIDLGSMQVKVPADGNVDGASSGGTNLYFGVVSIYTTSKKTDGTYFGASDYVGKLVCPLLQCTPKAGTPYVSGNYTYYPHMAYLSGNACLYNYYVYPTDTENYIFNQGINMAIAAKNIVKKQSLTISPALPLTVTVPETAKFGLYFQPNNFNTSEQAPVVDWVSNSNGTKTAQYKIPKNNGNYSWRLTDTTGTYVTKAGWLPGQTAAAEMTLSFDDASTDKLSHSFANLGTTTINRDEGDLQVNLAPTGAKTLTGTQRVRAYRWWELINSDTANIMLEPDFTWDVISGPATISYAEDKVTEITGRQIDGGNSYHNWADINANGGTSVIGVHYDAIDVFTDVAASNHGSHGGLYPATNADRAAFIVVSDQPMGSAAVHVPHNQNGSDSNRSPEWDYVYDTYYYLRGDEAAKLTFTASNAAKAEYAYATSTADFNYNVTDFTEVSAEEGNYNVPLTAFDKAANNYGGTLIIRLTDADGNYSYQLVHVAGMTVNIANLSSGEDAFMPGDQAELTFTGLYRSVNKMSGIFNPTTFNFRYTMNGNEITGTLGQYMRMDKAVLKVQIPADLEDDVNELTLTNGYVYGSMYSAANPFSTIYEMTDTGVGTNFNAVTVSWCMQNFADITIPVSRMPFESRINVTDGENTINGATVVITKENETCAANDGLYSLAYGKYKYDIVADGYIRSFGSFEVKPEDAEKAVDGVVTYDLVVEKATEKTWDGTTLTAVTPNAEGVYEISNGAELAWFASKVNDKTATSWKVMLTDDIDLGCNTWTPIGNASSVQFKGTFDGNGHTIRNLYCNGAGYQGLFGSVGAGGSIKNFEVYGQINSTKTNAGGIVGYTNGAATFDGLVNHADVNITGLAGTAPAAAGGIVGSGAATTKINNCYNTGYIYSSGKNVGGINGGTLAVKITNCYNTGQVTTDSTTLTSAGSLSSAGTVTNSYFLAGTTNGTKSLGVSKTSDELKNVVENLGDAFRKDCGNIHNGYPVLAWQHDKAVSTKVNAGKEATCTEAGATDETVCTVCKAVIIAAEEIPALGHDYKVTKEGKDATCTEAGNTEETTCARCNDVQGGEEIPALGHDYQVTKEGKDATCTEAGIADEVTCTRCNDVQGGEEIPALGHDYKVSKEAKDATCTEAGNRKETTCSRCKDVQGGEEIPALGHDYKVSKEAKDATCTEAGNTEETTCSRCNDVQGGEEIPALGHDYKVTKPGKAATCTEAGITDEKTCSRCNDVQSAEAINATGHSWDVTKEAKDATCTEAGNTEEKTCSRCNAVQGGEVIEATGHNWDSDYTVDKAATCTTDGSKSIHCSNCAATKDAAVISATGHSFGEWEEITSPNCTDTGSSQRICDECRYTETKDVDATGHNWDKDYTVDKAATDKADGSKSIHCAECDAVKDSTVIAKVGKVTLSKTKYVYNKKANKPAVTVKDAKGNKISADNYKVTYSKNKKVGKAKVTITFKGDYAGKIYKTFKINPKGAEITELTKRKNAIKVTWKRQTAQTNGYQIRYSAKANMTGAKTVTVKGSKATNWTIKNLKAKQKYYIQIRRYKNVNGVKYYGKWSKTKSATTK